MFCFVKNCGWQVIHSTKTMMMIMMTDRPPESTGKVGRHLCNWNRGHSAVDLSRRRFARNPEDCRGWRCMLGCGSSRTTADQRACSRAYGTCMQPTRTIRIVSMHCASQFRLFLTFPISVPPLVAIWSHPGQGYNSATRQFYMAVLVAWNSSLCTYIINFQKHAQDIFSHVLTSLTTRHWFAEYEQRTLYGALVVTLVVLSEWVSRV